MQEEQLEGPNFHLLSKLGLLSEDGGYRAFRGKPCEPQYALSDQFYLTGFDTSRTPGVIQINNKYTLSIEPEAIEEVHQVPNSGLQVPHYGWSVSHCAGLKEWVLPHLLLQDGKLSKRFPIAIFKPALRDYISKRKEELVVKQDKVTCGQAYAFMREMVDHEAYNWACQKSKYIKTRLLNHRGISRPLAETLADLTKAALTSEILKMMDTVWVEQQVGGTPGPRRIIVSSICEGSEAPPPIVTMPTQNQDLIADEGASPSNNKRKPEGACTALRADGRQTLPRMILRTSKSCGSADTSSTSSIWQEHGSPRNHLDVLDVTSYQEHDISRALGELNTDPVAEKEVFLQEQPRHKQARGTKIQDKAVVGGKGDKLQGKNVELQKCKALQEELQLYRRALGFHPFISEDFKKAKNADLSAIGQAIKKEIGFCRGLLGFHN